MRTRSALCSAVVFRRVALAAHAFVALICVAPRLANAEPCATIPAHVWQYLSMRHSSDSQLHSPAAAALVGALGLEWWSSSEWSCDEFHDPKIRGFFSNGAQYCVLLWGCYTADVPVSGNRACLVDSCGRLLWAQDVRTSHAPRVSQSGTVAFIEVGTPPNPVRVRFVDSRGTDRGVWNVSADTVTMYHPGPHAVLEFRPGTDEVLMLGSGTRKSVADPRPYEVCDQQLWYLSPTGEEIWRRSLAGSACRNVVFSHDGSLIIARGKNVLHVFDLAGREIATFDEPGKFQIGRILPDSESRTLFFFDGDVVALSLEDSRVTRKPAPDRLRELSQRAGAVEQPEAQVLLELLEEPEDVDE